jgi:hypothetical protein
MESDTPEHDDFGEWIDAQTPERLERITNRTLRDHGIAEMPAEDEISDALSLDIHNDMALVYIEDTFRSLEYQGLIETDGVDRNGEIIWGLTGYGKSSLSPLLTNSEAVVYNHFNEAEANEGNDDATDFDLPGRKPHLGTRVIAWAQTQVLSRPRS